MGIKQYNNGAIKKVSFHMKSEKPGDSNFLNQRSEVWFLFLWSVLFWFEKAGEMLLKGLLIFQAGKLKWQQL